MATMKKPVQRGTHAIVDDSLRSVTPGRRGRALSQLTQDLLDGKTCQVPAGTSFPDKTLRTYGFRLRSYSNDEGHVLWVEPLE